MEFSRRSVVEFESSKFFLAMHDSLRGYVFNTVESKDVKISHEEFSLRSHYTLEQIMNLLIGHALTISMNGGQISVDDIMNELNDKLYAVSDGHNDCDA